MNPLVQYNQPLQEILVPPLNHYIHQSQLCPWALQVLVIPMKFQKQKLKVKPKRTVCYPNILFIIYYFDLYPSLPDY